MDFTYTLDGSGWATTTLTVSDQSVSMTVSYLHDSLRELAVSILRLRAGESEAKVIFMDEPGEHHLILKRVGENVEIEVIWFDDWASWKLTPDTEPRRTLTATVPLAEFHHAVTNALAGLLDAFGLEGYKEKWIEHEFPLKEFETLRVS
jgi:hypothetical protein